MSIANFLRMAMNTQREEPIKVKEFGDMLAHAIEVLESTASSPRAASTTASRAARRSAAEILQMAMLEPEVAVLDETDSGLDIDALRTVAEGVNTLHEETGMGALVITHYQRILHYVDARSSSTSCSTGGSSREGGPELAHQLEREGYDWLREKADAGA